MNKDDLDMTNNVEAIECAEYFEDVNNCAAHAQARTAIMSMPDKLVVELMLEWATEKGYCVNIKWRHE